MEYKPESLDPFVVFGDKYQGTEAICFGCQKSFQLYEGIVYLSAYVHIGVSKKSAVYIYGPFCSLACLTLSVTEGSA